jgi:hypothetical protein
MPIEALEAMTENATGKGTERGWYRLPVWFRFSVWMLAAAATGYAIAEFEPLVRARSGKAPIIYEGPSGSGNQKR